MVLIIQKKKYLRTKVALFLQRPRKDSGAVKGKRGLRYLSEAVLTPPCSRPLFYHFQLWSERWWGF